MRLLTETLSTSRESNQRQITYHVCPRSRTYGGPSQQHASHQSGGTNTRLILHFCGYGFTKEDNFGLEHDIGAVFGQTLGAFRQSELVVSRTLWQNDLLRGMGNGEHED